MGDVEPKPVGLAWRAAIKVIAAPYFASVNPTGNATHYDFSHSTASTRHHEAGGARTLAAIDRLVHGATIFEMNVESSP
jgi:hypothetical protein